MGAALVCTGLFGAASTVAGPVTVQDDTGRTLTLAVPPQRLVSLLPSLTELVFALGAGDRVVGIDRYANAPAEVKHLPRLGGIDDALIEPIVALRPDVVLASTSSRALDRLEALGIRVLRLRSDSHGDVQHSLQLLGRLLGLAPKADEVWASVQQQTRDAANHVPPAWRGRRVYFELGGGPFAAGEHSFIGQTLAALGLVNIVPAALGPFPQLNPEFVLRAQPDLLMGTRADTEAMARRPGWSVLTAVRRGQHCGWTDAEYEVLTRPGPRLGQAAALVADCLQRLGAPR